MRRNQQKLEGAIPGRHDAWSTGVPRKWPKLFDGPCALMVENRLIVHHWLPTMAQQGLRSRDHGSLLGPVRPPPAMQCY